MYVLYKWVPFNKQLQTHSKCGNWPMTRLIMSTQIDWHEDKEAMMIRLCHECSLPLNQLVLTHERRKYIRWMQSMLHNSQHICLPRHSLISYLSPAKALLKQSRVVYKVCARIAHLYPVPLTLAPKNELPWYIKLIKPINQKWPLRPTGIDYNCQLISTTFIR